MERASARWLREAEERDARAAETAGRLDLSEVFLEEPVDLTTFMTDRAYLNNPLLSPEQYEAVRHIERVYYDGWFAQEMSGEIAAGMTLEQLLEATPREYDASRDLYTQMALSFDSDYWAQPTRMTNLVTLQWGKGSGKDHICRMAALRIAYLLLCLRNPQRYFEMPEQDTITMLNIASSADQANNAYFAALTRAVGRKGGWFEHKCEVKQGLITFERNVEAKSGHSDAEGQEGGNLILGVADEIDAFRSKEELEAHRAKAIRESPRAAESILKMLRTSASTRFPETYKNVVISYPRYLGSTIQKLTQRGRAALERQPDTSRHYVSGPLATWEVNPRVKGPSAFAEDYVEDRDMAEAMYECRPKRAIDTYFRNNQAIRMAFTEDASPVKVDYALRTLTSEITGKTTEVWEPVFEFAPGFLPIAGARYAIHADMAIKQDRAGIAMSHVVRWDRVQQTAYDELGGEVEQEELRPVVKTDFVMSFGADLRAEPAREIQIRWARQLCFELIRRGFHIASFTFDGFQSVDSMQILLSHGIESSRVSMDLNTDPWKNWRDLMYDGRHRMPFSARLLDELESLGLVNGKVDHPPGGSKDEADAVAGSLVGALVAGGGEAEDGEVAQPDSSDTFAVGYFTDPEGMDASLATELPWGLEGAGARQAVYSAAEFSQHTEFGW